MINNHLTIARRLATVRGERVELCLGIPIVKHPHYFDFYDPPVITGGDISLSGDNDE